MSQPTKLPKALEHHTRAFYDKLVELGKPDPELDGALSRRNAIIVSTKRDGYTRNLLRKDSCRIV